MIPLSVPSSAAFSGSVSYVAMTVGQITRQAMRRLDAIALQRCKLDAIDAASRVRVYCFRCGCSEHIAEPSAQNQLPSSQSRICPSNCLKPSS